MYDNPDAHQAVLEDQARCAAFADAILAAAPLIEGKTVLDVGCGAGLLSLLCAEAGAAQVYAVDASAGACELARRAVRANGLESKVTVIHGRAEAVALPVDKVDVIVSDFAGSALLHDSLLPALAAARDRWLAPGRGVMLPDAAALYCMAVDDRQHVADKASFWKSRAQTFDLDFSPALNSVVRFPRQDTLARNSQAITGAQRLVTLDLYRAGQEDLTFKSQFELTAQREGKVSALLAYFDVAFTCGGRFAAPAGMGVASGGGKGGSGGGGGGGGGGVGGADENNEAVVLTTHPAAPATGWLQTFFSFPRALSLAKGEQLSGTFGCRPVGKGVVGRMMDVDVEVKYQGATAKVNYQMRRRV